MENELSKLNKMKANTANTVNTELKEVIVVTHEKFHIDEAVAILLLLHFGDRIGIKIIDVEFVKDSDIKIEKNKIYLGVGNSEFDEHVFNGDVKKHGKSTATLVAEKLNINDHRYNKIVKYAHANDVNGPTMMTELGNLMKEKFNLGFSESEVWNFTGEVLLKKLNSFSKQREFKEISKTIKNGKVNLGDILKIKSFSYSFKRKSIKRIVLRKRFSVNDIIAVKTLQFYGGKFFVNSKSEKVFVKFIDEEKTYFPQKGDLVIGFGNGEFGKLPALKMFSALGINTNEHFSLLSNLVNNLNNAEGYHPWELQGLLIDRFLDDDCDDYGNFIFAMKEINLYIRKQKNYLSAKNEIERGFDKGKSDMKFADNGRKIGIFQSDSNIISNVAFGEFHCDTVIVKNSKGQVFIQTKSYNRKSKIKRSNLEVVVYKLRIKELLKKGCSYEELNHKILFGEGSVTICLKWYYHKPVEAVLNGSTTHSDVPSTKLSLSTIIKIVQKQLK